MCLSLVRRETSPESKLATSKPEYSAEWNPWQFLQIVSVYRENVQCTCVGYRFEIWKRSQSKVFVSDEQLSNKISIQMHAWWCCIATSFRMFALDIHKIECHASPCHCMTFELLRVSQCALCTFQVHWFQQWILRAYIHSDTINQHTKTLNENKKTQIIKSVYLTWASLHLARHKHSKSFATRCIQIILLMERNLVRLFLLSQPTHRGEVYTIISILLSKMSPHLLGVCGYTTNFPMAPCSSILRRYKFRIRIFIV